VQNKINLSAYLDELTGKYKIINQSNLEIFEMVILQAQLPA
jgi:hypothetical protein